MVERNNFPYAPNEDESEKASNSYLLSLIAIMTGFPIPLFNLIAAVIFYFGNKKGTYFVRWHCTQVLIAQAITMIVNSIAVYWTVGVLLWNFTLTNNFIAFILTAAIFNISEFIATIYSAIQTRKGKHISWLIFGPLTDLLVKDINV